MGYLFSCFDKSGQIEDIEDSSVNDDGNDGKEPPRGESQIRTDIKLGDRYESASISEKIQHMNLSGFPSMLGPFETPITTFSNDSFHFLDDRLESDNPFFILYRESFQEHQFLTKLIWNFPLVGETSPKHIVTLNETARESANIPPEAKYYVWSYPIDVEWRSSNTSDQRDLVKMIKKRMLLHNPDFLFLLMGGFVYFDEKFRVVRVNAIRMPRNVQAKQRVLMTAKGLNFAVPIPFEAKYIDHLMRHDRFKDAPAVEGKQRAKHFAWLLPHEEIMAPDQEEMKAGPHGAFVYLFSKLISRDEKECERNVYFNVLCHDVTCCPKASVLPCNRAKTIKRIQLEIKTDERKSDASNILIRSDTNSNSKGHKSLVPFTIITPQRDRRITEIFEKAPLPDLSLGKCDSVAFASTSLAKRGVSLEVLKELAKEFDRIKKEPVDLKIYGGRQPSYGEILVTRVIKERTKGTQFSYAEWMKRKNIPGTYNCNAYISHSWEYDFSETVRAVEKFEKERRSTMKLFYFCDFVSINHWEARTKDEINELRSLIGDVREMVLVLSPWDNPKFFHRTWFIFEIAQAIQDKRNLSIVLPPSEYKPLRSQIRKDFRKILTAINSIDSKTAKASENNTMEYLQWLIREELGGFAHCTRQVGGRLKRWLAYNIVQVDDENTNEFANYDFLLNAADFLQDKTEFYQRRALKMLIEFGQSRKSEKNLKAQILSARLLCNLEELEQSERQTQAILEGLWSWNPKKKGISDEHRGDAVKLIDLLAEVKFKLGKTKIAIQVQQRVIALSEKWYGEDSKSFWTCREHLGTMMIHCRQFEEARAILEDCISRSKNWEQTESDRVTLAVTMTRLATCLFEQGEYLDAMPIVNEALDILEKTSLSSRQDLHQAQCLYHDITHAKKSSMAKTPTEPRISLLYRTIYEEDQQKNLEDLTDLFANRAEEDKDDELYFIKRSASYIPGINADDYAQARISNQLTKLIRSKSNNSLRDSVQSFFSQILLTRLRELGTDEGKKIAQMFLRSLPAHIVMSLPRNDMIQSHITKIATNSALSGVHFRRSRPQESDKLINIFDREFSNTLHTSSCNKLKETEDVDMVEIEQMSVELKLNFHYTFKHDGQIKAELECRTRENAWMKEENQVIHRLIRHYIIGLDKRCAMIDYITKIILGYVKQRLPIPYFETNRTAEFSTDDLVLVLPDLEKEYPERKMNPGRPGRIVKLKQDSVVLEFIVEKQDSKKIQVSVNNIRQAFTWRCWRCQLEPKPDLWRDVYPDKKWISCIVCGLVTTKTGLQDPRFVKRHLIRKTLYGGVYFGFDCHFGRDVAIKECDKAAMRKKMTLDTGVPIAEDVKMEIELHSELCQNENDIHPGIIRLFDQYDSNHGKKLNVVLEWADGGELFDYVKEHFLGENSRHDQRKILDWQKEVQSMFFVICSAMKKIHDGRIVHRDMSLENVLLAGNVKGSNPYLPNVPRICDFGVAQRVKENPVFDERVGKKGYWSPECRDCKYDGRANDVWCLGVMLFTMLLGGKPYHKLGDDRYHRLVRGDLKNLIIKYQCTHLVPSGAIAIMSGIFKREGKRITIDQILKLDWCVEVEDIIRKDIFPNAE